MTEFTIASFNVKNLIGSDQEYYRFQSYTPEEYAWKEGWLADQMVTMNADVIGFQEIFEQEALENTIARADRYGAQNNAEALPAVNKRYRKRAIFEHRIQRLRRCYAGFRPKCPRHWHARTAPSGLSHPIAVWVCRSTRDHSGPG